MTDPDLIDRAAVLRLCTTLHHDLTADARPEAMDRLTTAALETGGDVILANPASTWGPHLNQVTAHGLSAQGATEEELLRNWIKVARSFLGTPDAPPAALVAARKVQLQAAILGMADENADDRTRLNHALIVMAMTEVGSDQHTSAHVMAVRLRTEMGQLRRGAAA